MNLKQLLEKYISKGFTVAQARSFVAQEVILSKIKESEFIDKVLLKGGVVMYNITQEKRRSTLDLDFDFISFDIKNDDSINHFIDSLNKKIPQYKVSITGRIEELKHQDYKGKRVKVVISDESESIHFKMDIGVHTLLGIKQNEMSFSFNEGKGLTLLVNPPEQIVAEKLFSLAKIGSTSQRFKDIDDVYFLIKNQPLDVNLVKECLIAITRNKPYGIENISDVVTKVNNCLDDSFFMNGYIDNGAWLNLDYELVKTVIQDFINNL